MQHVPPPSDAAIVALDWGTTSLRAWALDSHGTVLTSLRSASGLRRVVTSAEAEGVSVPARFAQALADVHAELGVRAVPTIACGMVGSAGGWSEAAHLGLPLSASPAALPLHIIPGTGSHESGHAVYLVPGLHTATPAGQAPDVLRGEETQVLGALEALGSPSDATLVLPGSHTKWLSVSEGAITDFSTCMTGELHAALLSSTILGDPVQAADPVAALHPAAAEAEAADAAFVRGVEHSLVHAQDPFGARIFTARTQNLSGEVPARFVPDYLSGLLIGDETLRFLAADGFAGTPAICAEGELGRRYAQALALQGVDSVVLEGTALTGLIAIGRSVGLLSA
ncbi:2-dehydro-3-deoxygalactonokinase [Galactobacter valiniphilus]|uniref:2-dehydro-3-deoxygalactonokinase n=1 Tax=Galactobacter valiniphilus TaxID=2676122 RepID=A0A399J7D8_9MICC|nr:2-dehydro-3-deoxygalactonokinase [Galactobacter valiniphilus]RII41050.1 2-dehydro-3-deoxygalactonokinase [Galactobacter valiniphilus]